MVCDETSQYVQLKSMNEFVQVISEKIGSDPNMNVYCPMFVKHFFGANTDLKY